MHLAIAGIGTSGAFASVASAQTNGTWNTSFGQSIPSPSWSNPSHWLNGAVPTNGGVATFVPVPLIGNERAGVIPNIAGLTLSGITFTSNSLFIFSTPGQAITLTGAATIDAQVATFRKIDAVSLGHIIQVPFAGSSGLTKTGPGIVALTANSTYTGGTFINGGVVIARRGDATFGAAGEPISIGSASLRVQDQSLTSSRPIHLTGAATFETALTTTLSGVLDGQSLTKTGTSTLALTAANTYTGATNVLAGVVDLGTTGSIAGSSSVTVRGSLLFGTIASPVNRINDAATITMQGGTLSIGGATSANYTETVGDTTFSHGTSAIAVDSPLNRTTTLALGNVSREERGAAFFFGRNLGVVPSQTAQTKITFAAAPALFGGGGAAGSQNVSIIPWAYAGTRNDADIHDPFTHATYGATGVRPLALSEYATSITSGAVSTNNVRLNGPHTVSAPSTINALRLAFDGGAFTTVIDGPGALTITSGSILNFTSGTINAPINFGPAEGVVIASSSLQLNGPISGSGGFTKQGEGGLFLGSSSSTYTGTTTLGGGPILYGASVPSGAPSVFGVDTSPIVLATAGNGSFGSGATVSLIYSGAAAAQFDRPIRVSGRTTEGNSINVTAFGQTSGAGTLTMNGAISLDNSALALVGSPSTNFNVAGNISGHGTLIDRLNGGTMTISGNNTFTGTVELSSSGGIRLASDSPFGSASIITSTTNPTLVAVGGPRTIPNNAYCFGSTNFWTIGGDQDITFTGAINLSSSFQHRIDNTATTTYAGVVSNGGFNKTGNGTLVLSNNGNTYTGTGTVSSGVLRATAPNALGSPRAPTVVQSSATLEVAALTDEWVMLVGAPTINTGGNLRSLSGNNSVGTIVFAGFDTTIIKVLAGALRTGRIGGSIDGGTSSIIVRKNGDGLLQTIRMREMAIAINGGSVAVLPSGTDSSASNLQSLSINNGTTLDLADNDTIISSSTATPQVVTYLKNGYNFGGFDGTSGIVSSAARNNPLGNTTLGYLTRQEYLDNNGSSTFDGMPTFAGHTLIKYTYFGDVDFNGQIDASDYNLIDFGFVNHLTGWANGDADYSGAVDVSDYNLIDFAFTTQNGVVLRAIQYLDGSDRSTRGMNDDPALQQVVEHFDQFGDAYAAGFLSHVPEPGFALLFGALPLLRRRAQRR